MMSNGDTLHYVRANRARIDLSARRVVTSHRTVLSTHHLHCSVKVRIGNSEIMIIIIIITTCEVPIDRESCVRRVPRKKITKSQKQPRFLRRNTKENTDELHKSRRATYKPCGIVVDSPLFLSPRAAHAIVDAEQTTCWTGWCRLGRQVAPCSVKSCILIVRFLLLLYWCSVYGCIVEQVDVDLEGR